MNPRLPLFAFAVLLCLAGCGDKKTAEAPPKKDGGAAPEATETLPPLPDVDLPSDHDAVLPVNTKVTAGTFDNGLRYFVRPNRYPEKRGQFWLTVDAGSFQEADDQQGLAHFIEHMAFNGTEKFPKNDLIKKLQELGVKFGPHINAFTSFDETVYKLQVPTDNPEAVDLALDILAEWAAKVSFKKADVDAERGVVLAEERDSQGAQKRLTENLIQKVFVGTRYANRLPIGKTNILKNAPVDRLTSFYKDWYHPKNMAVLAVGDFDGQDIEKKIRERFEKLEAPTKPRPAPSREMPSRTVPLVLSMKDKELPMAGVLVGRLMPKRPMASVTDFRRQFIEGAVAAMLSKRLDEARKKGDARYMMAAGGPVPLVRAAEGFGFFAAVSPDKLGEGLEDLVAEIERARRHGFVASELERAANDMITSIEQTTREAVANKESSDTLVEELMRHTLTGEAMPGRLMELAIFKHFAKTITVDDLKPVLDALLDAKDLIIVSAAPKGQPLTEAQALATFERAKQRKLVAYTDEKSDEPLLKEAPTPGTISEENTYKEIGVTEWKLSNGATVVLKPTTFKEDQIVVQASSPGGSSLVATKDLGPVRRAAEVTALGGLGAFDSVGLEKALAGRTVMYSPFVDIYEEGINGSSSVEDFEVLLQLLHLSFTAPRKDQKAFDVWRESMVSAAKMAGNSPEVRFQRKLVPLRSNKNPRVVAWTDKDYQKLDVDKALALYKERMKDAGDFTFYIVGSFDLATVKPLVLSYIGSLADDPRTETFELNQWPSPKKGRLTAKGGSADRASLSIAFDKEIDPASADPKARLAWQLFGMSLRLQLLDLFREDMGDSYSVWVNSRFHTRWHGATAEFSLNCAPERVGQLEKLALAAITKAASEGLADGYFQKAREGELKELETSLQSNSYWVGQLSHLRFEGRPLTDILTKKALLESLTDADLAAAAARFFDPKNPVIGVLAP